MTFKGYAETTARGFKTFQIKIPDTHIKNQLKRDEQNIAYLKENAKAYKEYNNSYLSALVEAQSATQQNLADNIEFRDENLKMIHEGEKKNFEIQANNARIAAQGAMSKPAEPSTFEKLAGLIGEYAPQIAEQIQAENAKIAKADQLRRAQLMSVTGLTTSQTNEILANERAIRDQSTEGIQLLARINTELGLAGANAITPDKLNVIWGLTGERQLELDTMAANNTAKNYYGHIQANLGTPLQQLLPDGNFAEGETLATVLDPNSGYDYQKAQHVLNSVWINYANGADIDLLSLPAGPQNLAHGHAQKINSGILGEYARGGQEAMAEAQDQQDFIAADNALTNTKMGRNPLALVEHGDLLRQRFGAATANDMMYNFLEKSVMVGAASAADIRQYDAQMLKRYPEVWKGFKRHRVLDLINKAVNYRQGITAQNERDIAQAKKDAQRAAGDWAKQNAEQISSMSPESAQELIQETFNVDPLEASKIYSGLVSGKKKATLGSEIDADDGGLYQAGEDALASKFISHHAEQNEKKTILKGSDFKAGTIANESISYMMAHARKMHREAYDLEYSQSENHERAAEYAKGVVDDAIKKGVFDLSPAKYIDADGQEQMRANSSELHWIGAPKGTTMLSDDKAQVVKAISKLKGEELTQAIEKKFLPQDIVASSYSDFARNTAVQAIMERARGQNLNLSLRYLYDQQLRAYGYEGLNPDEVLDPNEYKALRDSGSAAYYRIQQMDALPPSSYNSDQQISKQDVEGGKAFLRTSAVVDPNLGAPRKLPTIYEYPGQTNNAKAMIQTIIDVEAGGPWKFHRVVGHDTPEYRAPFDKMTVQEVYDMAYKNPDGSQSRIGSGTIPQRVGGGTIKYGASSHAAGAGQFHPDTMMSVIESMGLDPRTTYFTPALQLQMILQHAQNLGADVNGGYTPRLHSILGSDAAWEGVRKNTYASMKQKYENNLRKLRNVPQNTETRMKTWTNPYMGPEHLRGVI